MRRGSPGDAHPGLAVSLQRYNLVTDCWTEAGRFPLGAGVFSPVTAPVVDWRGGYVVPGGEIRPARGTSGVWAVEFATMPGGFGALNWVVLVGYLGGLVVIGVRCFRRESDTEDFLLGGRRIPWWAAWLSLFVTLLSAITFLAVTGIDLYLGIVLMGVLATALVLAGREIRYLWDFFLGLLGLIGGTLGGVMAVMVFLPSARAWHLWPAIVVSVGVLSYLKLFTPVNGLLLGFAGVVTVFLWVAMLTRVWSSGGEKRVGV